MSISIKPSLTAAVTTALLASVSTSSLAHPGWVDGGTAINKTITNTPTGYQLTNTSTARGYTIDAIRIGHGCNLDGSSDGVNDDPVIANSWTWPDGKGGLAPMSTQCDSAGANCTGAGTQPSVARIPDSSKKAHLPAGQGTATTLLSELVGGNTSCKTDSVTHVQTCTSGPGTTPFDKIGNRMQFLGNLGYFKQNNVKQDKNGNVWGFWAKGNKFNADQIKAMGITSAGAPYHNAVQILWSETQDTTKIAPFYFSESSCARKLVVRPAGADLCKLNSSVSKYNDDMHQGNFWFGGPTGFFTNGHGIHENFWLGYTLMTRDTTKNPYGASCKDKVNGDYDLVVMPTIDEINSRLPFPNFATKP